MNVHIYYELQIIDIWTFGFIEKAKYYDQKAFALDSNKAQNFYNLAWIDFNNENF